MASLSWISVGQLLNEEGILPILVDRMAEWVNTKLNVPLESRVFLGIDCWGSVLATQLSVVTGSHNYCFAARTGGETYTRHEILSEVLMKEIKDYRAIVLVTDVVATGRTLKFVYDRLVEKQPQTKQAEWLALSVLCYDRGADSENCRFLHGHGTACKDLIMPIVKNDALPDEGMLPARISLQVKGS